MKSPSNLEVSLNFYVSHYESIVRFHDPSVGFTLQFPSLDSSEQEQESKDTPALGGEPGEKDQKEETATADVVSLDSFRKK